MFRSYKAFGGVEIIDHLLLGSCSLQKCHRKLQEFVSLLARIIAPYAYLNLFLYQLCMVRDYMWSSLLGSCIEVS
jgi:hypothetical protein